MITRMVIRLENNTNDEFQAEAMLARFNKLMNDYGNAIIVKLYEAGECHLCKGRNGIYRDTIVVYYNDNYETAVKNCLRPYWSR